MNILLNESPFAKPHPHTYNRTNYLNLHSTQKSHQMTIRQIRAKLNTLKRKYALPLRHSPHTATPNPPKRPAAPHNEPVLPRPLTQNKNPTRAKPPNSGKKWQNPLHFTPKNAITTPNHNIEERNKNIATPYPGPSPSAAGSGISAGSGERGAGGGPPGRWTIGIASGPP